MTKITVPRLTLVENIARQVVRDQSVTALPVCPITIAEALGIIVQPKPMAEAGCSGMLVRLGNDFGIIYATHFENDGFERLSVAHELGHYYLPGHPEHVLRHGAHQSHAGFASNDPYEREADFFAASLLMPPALFRAAAARHAEGLEAVVRLSDICKTSLTATAISYAKQSHAAVAVILSTCGIVNCCFQSDALKMAKVGWLRPGTIIPEETVTSALARDPQRIAAATDASAIIELDRWFDDAQHLTATEEVVGLGRYGKVLTIIHCAQLTARAEEIESEEDEDEALIDSWTPRFRRS